ncbi:methionyl-tRNA formyltransferase [Candidatus Endomicrobiellum trichonymphae]|uniref:Methionyl-tRNA formyltransferase n=1 Tax=Endomicrobium trichonymphae TaxID=1408204 RepID=FMT_ENDTX|nr:methionyl-tRNA formyltransferase [Candidatus Endomicrobium trichonymphae]B1GZ11.1 RecName: Full=Methionyl-tRNA formyltransferase [Candidatus Endomicrobium trichonymphae]BAG13493.1 methionyl-tRNA formyltransferase [Candidatus Endomicrobium trichonymphae]
MRILFFGTAFISETYLKELHKKCHEIFVVTTPDKPALRGQKLIYPAVKVYAVKNNISFIQPEKFTLDVIETIKNFAADTGVAVAYGKLIPKVVFDIPKYKTFNIHFSLLPKYKGAAPVQHALCRGETETGISSFYIEEGLDTGGIIIQEKLNISIKDNAETLLNKLILLGIDVMNKTLELFRCGKCDAASQTGDPSFAPSLKKIDGLVNWNKRAGEIYNQFRGLYLWPGIYSTISQGKLVGKRIKFREIEVFDSDSINKDSGIVYSAEKNRGFTVSCAVGRILVVKMQSENKPVVSAWDFIQGRQISAGDRF